MNGHGPFVRTVVHDLSKPHGDAAATLYIAHRQRITDEPELAWSTAGNGEQVEGISVALAVGASFDSGQWLYKNEGPKNAYTARITTAVQPAGNIAYIGAIRSDKYGDPNNSTHRTYRYNIEGRKSWESNDGTISPGEGFYITTYNGEGGTDTYDGDPMRILMPGKLDDMLDELWAAADPNTKVGLAGKEINSKTGEVRYGLRSIYA